MNKRKIILGILIVMAVAICGVFWSQSSPYVFADATSAEEVEINIADAGIFEGCGYYEVNETAILKATMNPGYKFEAWVAVDAEGNETQLSTSIEYTFVVEKNITIKPIVSRVEYNVSFADDLWLDAQKTELKDFTYQITNNTQDMGKNYYNDQIQIQFNIKSGKYIYDLSAENIIITMDNLNTNTSIIDMNVDMNITNLEVEGFNQVVITFNIKENITIDIDYIYQYVLTLQSLNPDIELSEIMQFITLSQTATVLDESAYTYLVRADQPITISLSQGNAVYDFYSSQFQGQDTTNIKTKSYTLFQDSTFGINYIKKSYVTDFNSYLINLYGKKDLIQEPFYNIDDVILKAGEVVVFKYDEDSKQITIIDATNTEIKYDYPINQYGYKFIGFSLWGQISYTGAYMLSSTMPENVEIQLIFEYIEYSLEVQLVDEYFAGDVAYSVNYNTEANKLVVGTEVILQASTNEYVINGWSETNTPSVSGYVDTADEGSKKDTYTYIFSPISDDNSQPYVIYLDVDYSYLSVEYNLRANSIVKNVDYDIINVDLTNKTITFSDSETKLASQTITYADEDVAVDATKTIISTTEFGDIEIYENELTYTVNLIKHASINKTSQAGIDTYVFDKYTYFGELQLGVIEDITLVETGEEVTVNFNGNVYPTQDGFSGTVLTFTTVKIYNDEKGAYELNYYKIINENQSLILTAYLYMNGTDYDYIILRNVKYYYDSVGDKFVLRNATINTPKPVESVITKCDTYSIKLNNLLPNAILVYSTKSTNLSNYSFINYTNKVGTSLWHFEQGEYNVSILNSTTTEQLNANYRQLSNNITLLVNIESAYQYENILFTIEGDSGIIEGVGNKISAKDDEIVTITILQENIAKGYKFDNYTFANTDITNTGNPMVLTIVMDASIYANQIININFSAIQYTININYIDKNGEIVEQDDQIGYLGLRGQGKISTIVVDIVNEYELQAVTTIGYYVGNAYFGTEAYILEGLLGDNLSYYPTTTWSLNPTNFKQAIIDNAGDGTDVNLYIKFVAHTYSVKVYFEIATNAGSIIYPTLKMNGVAQTLTSQVEEENGISVTKRFVVANGFEHNSNITFRLEDFMMGVTIEKWSSLDGATLLEHSSIYTKTHITSNTVLKVILQYVPYNIEFVSLDENGEVCKYGDAHTDDGITTFKLFDIVRYTVNVGQGYVLKQKYYYDSMGIVGKNNIDSGKLEFNPANFKIDNGTTFKIYLVFGLKSINLKISNIVDGDMYYFEGQEVSDLASYTVSRQRGETIEAIDEQMGYQFFTGDKIIMQISPISIGIQLNNVKLDNITINLGNKPQYSLNIVELKEEGQLIAVNYEFVLEFTPEIISELSGDEDVTLQNVLGIKLFNVTYTYNYIDYNFGIRLTRRYESGSSATDNADTEMNINGLGFGTGITFGCTWEGMNTGEGSKFVIDGYTIAGIKQASNSSNDRFTFNDIQLWESVAMIAHSENLKTILVVLELRPKITLNNYANYSEGVGYVYNNAVYNGEQQGLVAGTDVVIGGDFKISIKYSSDNFEGEYPIDAGEYNVEIKAIISEEIPAILFDESVTYLISKAPVSVSLKTFNSTNPITKTYGEADEMYLQTIAKDIIFNGIYSRDAGKIYVDNNNLGIKFMSKQVNTMDTLCDVVVSGIRMLNESNKETSNYKLSAGSTVTFSRIGKIDPKALEIMGFKINNKVYDGTKDVYVDTNDIVYNKPENDFVEILNDNLKFYLEDYTVGKSREVFVDWSTALIGADSSNYVITYAKTYIDVHPYEISYTLEGYGTFKIVDVDKKALIPIGSRVIVKGFEKGSFEYRTIYSLIEGDIRQGEKLTNCFEVIMQVNSVNVQISEGLYVFIPKVNKATKVAQVYQEGLCESLEYMQQGDYTVARVIKGDALFGVVSRTTYLPLWAIILIVIGVLVLIAILVILFIIIRRKTKRKYSTYDRI